MIQHRSDCQSKNYTVSKAEMNQIDAAHAFDNVAFGGVKLSGSLATKASQYIRESTTS